MKGIGVFNELFKSKGESGSIGDNAGIQIQRT